MPNAYNKGYHLSTYVGWLTTVYIVCRSTTGVVPPLSVRATLAAWPQNGVNANTVLVNGAHHNPGNRTNSTFHATAPFHGNIQGMLYFPAFQKKRLITSEYGHR